MYITFLENIFRPKYIDLVQSVQSCSVYRYVATSAKGLKREFFPSVVTLVLLNKLRELSFLSKRNSISQ